jgi:hypothetical protein
MDEPKRFVNLSLFKTEKELNEYVYSLFSEYGYSDEEIDAKNIYLTARLRWNMSDPKLRAAEYHYLNRKYRIGEPREELPICLFSTSYNIFKRG